MTVEGAMQNNYNAYAYCIRNASPPSSVIANYKSKFNGYDGYNYAQRICSDCNYYEVPDVIVSK